MAAGARDNISPRARVEYYLGYYAADVLDPDGYSFEVVCVWQLVLAQPWQLTLAHPLVSYVNDPRLTAGKGCRGRAA